MKAQRRGAHLCTEQKIPLLKNTRFNLGLQTSLEKSYGLTKGNPFQVLTIILIASEALEILHCESPVAQSPRGQAEKSKFPLLNSPGLNA